jgi:hypothetical protein
MIVPVLLDFLFAIPFGYTVAAAIGVWVFICLVVVDA